MNYQDINAKTIDRWVQEGWEWGKPISHETYISAKNGSWDVFLTPTKPVPHHWFRAIRNKTVLGLASGGGQQMPIFTALGASCTVLDYSRMQLEAERMVAAREGYDISIVHADMTKPFPFADAHFDLIFFPVANCYVADLNPIWRECFRVLKPNGILLSGLDNGLNFLFDETQTKVSYTLPFDPLHCEEHRKSLEADDSGMQFSHSIEDLIGGQLRAGLRLTDIYGDTNGCGNLHDHNADSFWATRSVKEP